MDDALQVVFPPLFDHYETLWPKVHRLSFSL